MLRGFGAIETYKNQFTIVCGKEQLMLESTLPGTIAQKYSLDVDLEKFMHD